MSPRHYTNPVHDGYLADPFVWRAAGGYFAVGTGPAEAGGEVTSGRAPTVFPLLRSHDLVHWAPAGRALVRPDEALGDTFWAPEVAHAHGQWWLYYSVGHGDSRHQLRVAIADRPEGPYVDREQLTDPGELPFAIDPHPFRDADGRWYLFYARDYLEAGAGPDAPRAGTALAACPLPSMTRMERADEVTVARARCEWQRFAADRPMYGRTFDWHTLEGPFVVRSHGRYWCLYSGGCWQTPTYGIDFVVADAVLGPYHDTASHHGPRVLRSVPERVLGPGHCSVVTGPDGRSLYLAYHAWDAQLTARRMCIDRLEFGPDGPRAIGPSCTPQPTPAAAQRARDGTG